LQNKEDEESAMEREESSAEFIGRLRRPRWPVRTPVARDDPHEVKYLEMIDQLQVDVERFWTFLDERNREIDSLSVQLADVQRMIAAQKRGRFGTTVDDLDEDPFS
jgi:hypothetical protein